MKLSLSPVRGGLIVLAMLAPALLLSSASCAGNEVDGTIVPPLDPDADAGLPRTDAAPEEDTGAPPIEAGARTCSDDGLCHTALPAGQTLRGVWGDGAGSVWSVTSEGNLLRWNGTAWAVHVSGLGPLLTVWGSSPTDVWLGGDRGVYHGTGASAATLTFDLQTFPGDITVKVSGIWGASATDVWAVGTMEQPDAEPLGRVLHFIGPVDGGPASWVVDPASNRSVRWTKVWGNVASGVWLAGDHFMDDWGFDETVVYRRPAGASAFAAVTLPLVPDQEEPQNKMGPLFGGLALSDTSIVLLARSLGAPSGRWIGTSADGGKTFTWTFTQDALPTDPPLTAAAGSGPDDIWTVGDYGRAFHWNGTSQAPVAVTISKLPVIDPLYAVWSRSPSETWIVGKNHALRLEPSANKDGGAL